MAVATDGPKLVAGREYDANVTSSEVNEIGETHDQLLKHVATVSEHADMLQRNWQARVRRDGKIAWVNPFAPRGQQTRHPTKEACQQEIDDHYSAQAEAACMTNQSEKTWTPQPIIIEPERTLEDYMGPKAAAMVQAAKEVAGSVQNLGAMALRISGRQVTAAALVAMPESQSIPKIGMLSDDQLKELAHRATFNGKKKLAKAAKDMCTARGIQIPL